MCRVNISVLILGIVVAIRTIECRKYDVNAECFKLYGEDLKSVLARFRKTPDYLKILNLRTTALKKQFEDNFLQTTFYYNQLLKEKVSEKIGFKLSDLTTTPTPMHPNMSQPGQPPEPVPRNFKFRRLWKSRAEESNGNKTIDKDEDARKARIERLDSYFKLSSTLTLAQRNSLKDLGFEYAGNQIHSLIRSGGGDLDTERSTRLPYGGDKPDNSTSDTTQHVLVHDVKKSTMQTTAGDQGTGTGSTLHEPEKIEDVYLPAEAQFRYRPFVA